MTTMTKLATLNVTIDFVLPMECMTLDDFIAMGDDKLHDLFEQLEVKMIHNTASKLEEEIWAEIECYYDHKYYYDNIDAFDEYRSHMGEPDFDWDFYSDWHKDMYGFRPH
jgi:hypothetical protein